MSDPLIAFIRKVSAGDKVSRKERQDAVKSLRQNVLRDLPWKTLLWSANDQNSTQDFRDDCCNEIAARIGLVDREKNNGTR